MALGPRDVGLRTPTIKWVSSSSLWKNGRAVLVQRSWKVALRAEGMRIQDARMLRTPAQRRPHYPSTERLATRELRAARRLLVTPATVASRM